MINQQTLDILYINIKLATSRLPCTMWPTFHRFPCFAVVCLTKGLVEHLSKIEKTRKLLVLLYSEPGDG